MFYAKKMKLLALTLPLLTSGCATLSPPLPPVMVAQTCPNPAPLPEELTQARKPNLKERGELSLTKFFTSLPKPTKP